MEVGARLWFLHTRSLHHHRAGRGFSFCPAGCGGGRENRACCCPQLLPLPQAPLTATVSSSPRISCCPPDPPPARRFLGWLFLRRPPFSSPPAVGWRAMPRRCTGEAVKTARAASRVLNQQQCPAPGRTPQLTCMTDLISFWGNSPWSGGQDAPSLQALLSLLNSQPPEQLRETNRPRSSKPNQEKGDKNHGTELGRVCGGAAGGWGKARGINPSPTGMSTELGQPYSPQTYA